MKSTNDNNLDTEDEDETPKKNIKPATFLIGVFRAAGGLFRFSLQNQLARQNVQSFSNHTNTTSSKLGFLPDAKPHQSDFPPFWWGFL